MEVGSRLHSATRLYSGFMLKIILPLLLSWVALAMGCAPGGSGTVPAWPSSHDIPEDEASDSMARMGSTWTNRHEWVDRRARIVDHVLEQFMLDPFPRREPIEAVIHSRIDLDGYSVSNVLFESFPGFFVSGNLYEPLDWVDPRPIVLCPHGHRRRSGDNPEGRMQHDYQYLCATLARMGAIVFTWDMVGWGENGQMDHRDVHAGPIQLWNTIRAIDFVTGLPDSDPGRIGCTGSSGGGTQTFLATMIDQRITCSAPVVMVSANWFGGCPCESGLPIHQGDGFITNNVEFAACAAPRPQLLVSVGGDWTSDTPDVEFPYLCRVYGVMGQGDAVENVHLADQGHDFGPNKRAAVYSFLARRLGLDRSRAMITHMDFDESPVRILHRDQLLAITPGHPLPEDALEGTEEVVARWKSLPRPIPPRPTSPPGT